jgi:double-strand break repair protein MRE11
MSDVSLKEASPALLPHDQKSIEKFLCARIEELILQASDEWLHRQGLTQVPEGTEIPLPLVRLKVDYSGGFNSFNPHRFGHLFVNRVANPKEVIFFYRRRSVNKNDPILKPMDEFTIPAIAAAVEERSTLKMEDLVKDFLQVQHLDLLPQNEFGDIVRIFVEKDDKESIEG